MAFITLSGTLLDPNGDLAVGDQIRLTHKSTTGETVESAVSIITINPAGTYSLPLQYGLVLVEYKDVRKQQFKNLGIATVNQDNPATSIPELLNALVPVSSAELIEFQAILADCVAAQLAAENAATTAEAFAYQLTTTDLIASTAVFSADTNIPTSGFTASGDGGNGNWKQNGTTGQTPSQSPAQLGDALLNDGNGNQWELVTSGGVFNADKLGDSSDWSSAVEAACNAAINSGGTLYLGDIDKTITRQLTFTGIPNILSGGADTVNIATNLNVPVLSFTLDTIKEEISIGGFSVSCNPTGSNDGTAFIEIKGNTELFQYNRFSDIDSRGFESLIIIDKESYFSTASYYESPFAWNRFNNINVRGGAYAAKNLIHFKQGTGTGNSFNSIKGKLDKSDAAFVFCEGGVNNAACGDIIWGNANGSGLTSSKTAILKIANNTTYNSRLCIVNTQFDAGLHFPVVSDQVDLSNLTLVGNNVGGGSDFYQELEPIRNSQIHDRGISEYMAGTDILPASLPIGDNDIVTFTTKLAENTGCLITLTVDGKVDGVGSGIAHKQYLFRRTTSAPVRALLSDNRTPVATGFFLISEQLISDGRIKFSVNYIATGADNTMSAQIRVDGGKTITGIGNK